jgi:hypothetical protein
MTTDRRPLDRYDTNPWQTRALLAHVPEISGRVVEPCSGDNSIARVLLLERPGIEVRTNDIDPSTPAQQHMDATGRAFWEQAAPFDWAVSNTPFEMPTCLEIVQHAVTHAKVGVALMLRLTFLEPTDTRHPRGPWLEAHPLSRLLVLPRYSFTGNGKSDSVTTAWFLWSRKRLTGRPLLCLNAADVTYATIPELEQEARHADAQC